MMLKPSKSAGARSSCSLGAFLGLLGLGLVAHGVAAPASPAPRFFFIPGEWSWTAAQADARARGGHLATITSAEEYLLLQQQVGPLVAPSLWLGGARTAAGASWAWVTDEPWAWSAWSEDEPDGVGDDHGHVGRYLMAQPARQWAWADASDLHALGYVLEVEAPGQPVILVPPQSQSARPAETVSFTVTAAGAEPLAFQWLRRGTALPEATQSTLVVSNAQPPDMGTYRVVVSNPWGAVTSAPAKLELDYPERPGRPDPAFAPVLLSNGSLPLSAQARALAIQSDGRVVVGGRFRWVNGVARPGLARLQTNGGLDETFAPPPLAPAGNGYVPEVNALAVLDDGRILVGGRFTVAGPSGPREGLIRLRPDGTLDADFACALEAGASVAAVLPLAGGRALIAGRFRSVNGLARPGVARLNADGSCDPSFAPPLELDAGWGPCALAVQPDGSVLVGLDPAGGLPPSPALARLQPDGRLDANFRPALPTNCAALRVVARPDGRLLVGTSGGVVCLTAAGNRDEAFSATPRAIGAGAWPNALAVQPDGRVLIEGHWTEDGAESWGLLRLEADGQMDPTFVVEPALSPVLALALTSEGQVLVGTEGRVARIHGLVAPCIVREPQGMLAQAGLTARLEVAAQGTPPLSFQWLADGQPVPGATNAALEFRPVQPRHAAAYQVVISNRAGSVTSASPAVLQVRASAPETVPPRLAILWPAPGAQGSNLVWRVQGVASDNRLVQEVWYQLNQDDWRLAAGTTNWVAEVRAVPGTNRFRAYCLDAAGNRSPTHTVRFFRVVPERLSLEVLGQGRVHPFLHGRLLAQGRQFAVTATPAEGWLFSHWTGQAEGEPEPRLLGRAPTLVFAMRAGLQLQAHFARNPFPERAGRYRGLIGDTSEEAAVPVGIVAMTLTPGGAFSGRLVMAGSTNRFTGQFEVSGQAAVSLPGSGGGSWRLELRWDPTQDGGRLTGVVSDGTNTFELEAARVGFDAREQPAPWAGRYTLLLTGALAGEEIGGPSATLGWGTVTLGPNGQARLAGALADGTAFHHASLISPTGAWPLFVPLDGGHGTLAGRLQWRAPEGLSAECLRWIRPPEASEDWRFEGFTGELALLSSPYTSEPGRPVLDFTRGVVVFEGGSLTAPLVQPVWLTASNRVVNLGQQPMTLRLNVADGSFRGTFQVPGTNRTNAFQGVVLQNRNCGAGFFREGASSGRVYFGPVLE